MTQELENKMFSDSQLLEFVIKLDSSLKESLEAHDHFMGIDETKMLWWFKHKLISFLNGEENTRQLTDLDKQIIKLFALHNFSIGDTAFVVNRSKSTVHEYLTEIRKPCDQP